MIHRLGFLVIILLLFFYVSKSVVDYGNNRGLKFFNQSQSFIVN